MRTFIKPKKKQEEEKIEIRIDADVLESLRAYSQFLDSPQSYIVSEVLRMVFRKDRAFAEWRKAGAAGAGENEGGGATEATSAKRTRQS